MKTFEHSEKEATFLRIVRAAVEANLRTTYEGSVQSSFDPRRIVVNDDDGSVFVEVTIELQNDRRERELERLQSVLSSLDLFSEDIAAYLEDNDYCWKKGD